MHTDMAVEASSLPGIVRDMLAGYFLHQRQRGAEVCFELIRLWDQPLVNDNVDDALRILTETFSHLFSKAPEWTEIKSTFATQLCESLSTQAAMSDSLSALLNTAVGVLLPEVRLAAPVPGLSQAFKVTRPTPTSLAFWARFATRCAKRTKFVSLFTDLPSLVKSLPNLSAPQQKGYMLRTYLELLLMLEDRGQSHEEATAVVNEVLQPLRKQLEQLLSEATFGKASCADLHQISGTLSTLTGVESMLFEARLHGEPKLPKLLEAHLNRWAVSFKVLEEEAPFLDALQRDMSGIPKLVGKLNDDSKFRTSKADAMHESSSTMQARAMIVHDWLKEVSPSRTRTYVAATTYETRHSC